MRGSLAAEQLPESAFWESDGRDIDSGCGI